MYFVAITENVNRQSKNNLINDDNDNMAIIPISWNRLLVNLTYPSMECKCTTTKEIGQIIKSLKTKNAYGYDKIST